MTRASYFWLLGLLSASCVVNGFTIEDRLPGAGGSAGAGVAASSAGGTPSTSGGTSSQGGDGASGAVPQGGKAGMAGSQGDAGSPVADAGEPSVGQGGSGEGGAPSGASAPCDPTSNGLPPLLCEDFESGLLDATKWMVPAGLAVTTGPGPNGPTKLVYLDGPPLATQLDEFPISEAAGEVTVSFWLKVVMAEAGSPIIAFRDRSAAQSTIRLSLIVKELGWRSSASNFMVPQMPTAAMLTLDAWTCVSIHIKARSMVLSYQSQGAPAVSSLTLDDVSTPNVDANWQMLAADSRYGAGFPGFGGALAGAACHIYVDDVRIAADTSSVCPF